ncbi:MAG: cyclic nucleotide-binding domain-containing protein [Chloroflexales bacterium]|nr:cyclic nucleotide-binding domain-containing protein [Chloroflexales bacterium]
MSISDLMGNLGFILIALSFLVRDIVWLRILSILSQLVLIGYNYFGPPEPLWLVINWSLLFLAINVFQIWALFRERRAVRFTDQEQELYGTIFRALAPVEFLKLLRIASWAKADPGQTLATAGTPLDDVLLIYHGAASVQRGGQTVGSMKDGAFIGEMEFFSTEPAAATVVVTAPTAYLKWSRADLRKLFARNPSMVPAVQAAFSAELIQKLHSA